MQSTSESLLFRLTQASPPGQSHSQLHADAWSTFVELYTPLIFFWARKMGLQIQDASDLVQDVLTIVYQKIPSWKYDSNQSFRGWLRKVTLNRHREIVRRKTPAILDPASSVLGNLGFDEAAQSTWDVNYARKLVEIAMNRMRTGFAEKTWMALQELVSTGNPAADIAKKHDLSVWTLYAAKSRLFSCLRKELQGLL